MDISAHLTKLRQKRWHDEYFLQLAIMSHVREVTLLSDKAMLNKTSDNLTALDKEMMDLFILLSIWAETEPELLEGRIGKFFAKLSNKA